MQKMGWFGVVRGHSRSTAMSPFDRAHTTSYYSPVAEGVPVCKKNVREVSLHFHELDHVA